MANLEVKFSRFGINKKKMKPMDEKLPAEIEENILNGLKIIAYRQEGCNVSTSQYMELYSTVYKLCSKNNNDKFSSLKPIGLNDSNGFSLYHILENFISTYARSLVKEFDGYKSISLLNQYKKIWTEYLFVSKVVGGIFNYLDRHWIARQVDDGVANIYSLQNLFLKCWQDYLFMKINTKLVKSMIYLIDADRNNECISIGVIKDVLVTYVEMCVDNTEKTLDGLWRCNNMFIYDNYFEEAFIDATKNYYKNESSEVLSNNNIVEYMRKVDARIKEEKNRSKKLFNDKTLPKLILALDEILIKDYVDLFTHEFAQLIEKEAMDDLSSMYNLCSRVPDSLSALQSNYEGIIYKKSCDIINNISSSDNEPKQYVDIILEILSKYNTMTERSFNNNAGFVKALDQACSKIINSNNLCKKEGRSAELLARYCDYVFRKSSKKLSDDEIECVLNQIMTVFKYIEDKDIFHQYYSKYLAKRLIYELSCEDYEKILIQKLKEMCGFEYTNKIQRMFNDISTSRDITVEYKRYVENLKNKSKLEMSLTVLTACVWPLPNTDSFTIPEQLVDNFQHFSNFYSDKHKGRKLTFLSTVSKGEIICNYPKGKRYAFVSTLLQMSILLMYNDYDEHTIENLMKTINIKKLALIQGLQALIKVEILKLENGKLNPNIDSNTKVIINPQFTSRKIRIDLSKATSNNRVDSKKEAENVKKDVEEDRKMVIQAAIVRVMKMRKQLKHSSLVSEVIKILSIRFNPNIKMIKKCIDILIDKEYMRRSETEHDLYEYIS